MNDYKYIRSVCMFQKTGEIRKELAFVKLDGKDVYLIGYFNCDNDCVTGIALTEREMLSLLKLKEKDLVKEKMTEEEKFQRDYLQQSHNGSIEDKEKEFELW